MNWSWKIVLLPLFFLILLGLSSFIFFYLYRTTTYFEHETALLSMQIHNTVFSQVENTASFFTPLNSSASTLANILTSSISLNGTHHLSFNLIQEKVAPSLFVAFSTTPYVSQASYVGRDGLMFMYYNTKDGDIFVVFSNSSSSSSSSSLCYTQAVNRDTGKLSEEARITNLNVTSIQQTVNLTAASTSLGAEWSGEKGLVFLYNAVALGGRGVITIGYPTKVVANHFAHIAFNNGNFHLATRDGRALVESKLEDFRVHVRNDTVSVEVVDVHGYVEEKTDFFSCKSDYGKLSHFHIKIRGIQRLFYCSTLEIGGIESVYVVAFPMKRVEKRILTLVLLVLVLVLVVTVVSIGVFIVVIMRSARREVLLRVDLMKQIEATEQAESKSTNKSVAFASASHDIRASLAAISGLIDLCRGTAKPNSEMAASLDQMSSCATDLLGILNSVLDMSKLEAGRMQLEEEEFDVAQLLEDVVDMFYPLSMKKGVDVVLDPTDFSILRFSHVKGDRGKLKQIFCNLLSNATKFTSQGYISVRAMVKKSSTRNETTEENHDCMEYVFDVDDTGIGIPKESRESVFENFVQVKETALGQGTGLGLGIIQLLVRLMGGEIKIVDKDDGERGTCFRFNVFLMQGTTNTSNDRYPNIHRFGMQTDSSQHASHVVLFLAGKERMKVTKRWMQRCGLTVSTVETSEDLVRVLERMEPKIELSSTNESSCSLLVVLDANAAPAAELCSVLGNLREHIQKLQCKIVLVENPMRRNGSNEVDDEGRISPCHHILSRPLHGSHLYRVLRLLPEFGGEEIHSSSQDSRVELEVKSTGLRDEIEVVVVSEDGGEGKALSGKNVLLVEDDRTLCMLSKKILQNLGATVNVCENGKEALDIVCMNMRNKEEGSLPFDYIFMDCKMPFIDGFEATRLIRNEERGYGIRTPIIALTAYSTPEEISRVFDAGMDFHLLKPITIQNVLNLIHNT